MTKVSDNHERWTIGVDLGDKDSSYCMLDGSGDAVERGQLKTTQAGFRRRFEHMEPGKVVVETGTHSPWVAELLTSLGHEVLVADARRIELISRNDRKSDRRDAELLARLGRVDLELLHPVKQRGTRVRRDLSILRSRMVSRPLGLRARTRVGDLAVLRVGGWPSHPIYPWAFSPTPFLESRS